MKIERIEAEGYENVVMGIDPDSGLRAIIAVHDTTLGPALGGLRMWNYKTDEEAITDVCHSNESKEVTLVFTEAEANEQAAKMLAQTEMPQDIPLEINSVHIDFQADNNVETEAGSKAYGLKFTIKVKIQVGIDEGKPVIEVRDVNFGFVPLPKPVKNKITELIPEKIDALLAQMTAAETDCIGKVDLEFTDINIQQDTATITVIVKPTA